MAILGLLISVVNLLLILVGGNLGLGQAVSYACGVREGQEKGKWKLRVCGCVVHLFFPSSWCCKDTKQAPAPWVSVAVVRQALLPSCGEWDRGTAAGTAAGTRGSRECPGRPCGGAGMGSHSAQQGITSHGGGPGPPSLALACSRTLRANLHCTGPCACNSLVGIVPMLHETAGCWSHRGKLLPSTKSFSAHIPQGLLTWTHGAGMFLFKGVLESPPY